MKKKQFRTIESPIENFNVRLNVTNSDRKRVRMVHFTWQYFDQKIATWRPASGSFSMTAEKARELCSAINDQLCDK